MHALVEESPPVPVHGWRLPPSSFFFLAFVAVVVLLIDLKIIARPCEEYVVELKSFQIVGNEYDLTFFLQNRRRMTRMRRHSPKRLPPRLDSSIGAVCAEGHIDS